MGLFGSLSSQQSTEQRYAFTQLQEWSTREKLEKEKEVIGFYLSGHPLGSFQHIIDALDLSHHKDLHLNVVEKKYLSEPIVTTCGLLQTHKIITTKKGDKMAFAQIEDLTGPCEVIIFPSVYAKISSALMQHNEFIVVGALDITAQQQCKIKANALIPLDTILHKGIAHATFVLTHAPDAQTLTHLKSLLTSGSTLYCFEYSENEKTMRLTPREHITLTNELLSHIRSIGIQIRLQVRIE
jgi:DNA polymerase-3 subunit alpha